MKEMNNNRPTVTRRMRMRTTDKNGNNCMPEEKSVDDNGLVVVAAIKTISKRAGPHCLDPFASFPLIWTIVCGRHRP
eukprot:11688669-Ditylum_brightwellii.AAC.1